VEFFLLLFLLLISALFSGAETAIMSLEMSRIKALKAKKKRSVEIVEWLKENPRKVIITLLIVNNVLNTVITVLATILTDDLIDGDQKGMALTVVTVVVAFFLIIFGDVLPKSIAVVHREKYSLFIAPFVFFLTKVFVPFIFLLEILINFFTPYKEQQKVTEEEVLAMVSMGEAHGEITSQERDRIESVLELSDTKVSEIMTPRTDITAIEEKEIVETAIEFFRKHQYSRIPVYQGDMDNVVGILTMREILEAAEQKERNRMVKNIEMKSPFFIPITKKIAELLEDFKRQKTHIAIVVDEHGGTAGLVTMEDILEEIFGEIQDETDEDEDLIRKIDENIWASPPNITVEEVYDETGILLDPDENNQGKTLSLLILEVLERFPRRGESIPFPGGTIVIERMGARRVERVRIYPLKS